MRVLITGLTGFAGTWLARACTEAGDEVAGLTREDADLIDADEVRRAVAQAEPEVVYHLAALSSVGRSWSQPGRTLHENVAGAANLLEAVRLEAPRAQVVWASSCEVYGTPETVPIPESARLRPESPYAVSKLAGEQLVGVYVRAYGLRAVIARPFNHTGPGQRDIFIVSSLARQAAEARLAGAAELRVVTGNPQTRRDFTDVRDVARAYRLLAAAPGLEAGEAFNVSSGVSRSAAEQVELLDDLLPGIEVTHIVDPARVRAHEVMELAGAPDRIGQAVGWAPEIDYRETMRQTIEWWFDQLSG